MSSLIFEVEKQKYVNAVTGTVKSLDDIVNETLNINPDKVNTYGENMPTPLWMDKEYNIRMSTTMSDAEKTAALAALKAEEFS